MLKKFTVLRSPEDGDGEGGMFPSIDTKEESSGSKGGKSTEGTDDNQSAASRRRMTDDNQSTESDDEDDESTADFMKRQLEGYSSQGDEDEEEEETKETKDQEDEKDESSKKDSDDIMDLDPDRLVDSKGKAVSAATKDSFKKLREAAARYREESEATKKRLEELQSKFGDPQEIERLKKEHEEFKKVIETEHFQNDPQFIKTYKEPIRKYRKEAEKWLATVEEGPRRNKLMDLMISASSILVPERMKDENSEVEFTQILDRSTEYLSPTASRRFVDSMVRLYDSYRNFYQASEDKEGTLSQLRLSREQQLEKEVGSASEIIDASLKGWMERNDARIKYYNEHEEGGFEKERNERLTAIKDGLKAFKLSGEVPPSLAKILVDASVAGSTFRSEERLAKALNAAYSKTEEQEKKIKELESKLEKISGSGLSARGRGGEFDDDDDNLSLGQFVTRQLRK